MLVPSSGNVAFILRKFFIIFRDFLQKKKKRKELKHLHIFFFFFISYFFTDLFLNH